MESLDMLKQHMNCVVIVFSYHHHNTEKIAHTIAEEIDAQVFSPLEFNPEDLTKYELVGFGSGIYSESFHKAILDFVEKSPLVESKKAFLFSTDGAPRGLIKDDHPMAKEQLRKNHRTINERLEAKGYEIIGEFNCAGWNSNSFLKLFGGINKSRPNEQDLSNAREFAQGISGKITSDSL